MATILKIKDMSKDLTASDLDIGDIAIVETPEYGQTLVLVYQQHIYSEEDCMFFRRKTLISLEGFVDCVEDNGNPLTWYENIKYYKVVKLLKPGDILEVRHGA